MIEQKWIPGVENDAFINCSVDPHPIFNDDIIPIGAESYIEGMATDSTYLYWADVGARYIGRSKLDGSEAEPHWIKLAKVPTGLAVDGTHLYWVNFDEHIGRVKLDGTGLEEEWVKVEKGAPYLIAVSATHVYWTRLGYISRCTIAGAEVEDKWLHIEYPGEKPSNLNDIIVVGEHLYFCNTNPNEARISRCKLDGTELELNWCKLSVKAGEHAPAWFLASDETYIFWTTGFQPPKAIGRVAISEPNKPEYEWELVPNKTEEHHGTLGALTCNGSHLYFTDEGSPETIVRLQLGQKYIYFDTENSFIGRAHIDGTSPEWHWLLPPFGEEGKIVGEFSPLLITEHYIYFIEERFGGPLTWGIARCKLDGTEFIHKFITLPTAAVHYIAANDTHIYASNEATGCIERWNIDGTEHEPEWMKEVEGIGGIAVNSTHIFWTSGVYLNKAKLDGSGPELKWIKTSAFADRVVADETHVYLRQNHEEKERIYRYAITGPPTPEYIPAEHEIRGLAIDTQHVYWVNLVSGTLSNMGRALLTDFLSAAEEEKEAKEKTEIEEDEIYAKILPLMFNA